MAEDHSSKIARLLYRDIDVDGHEPFFVASHSLRQARTISRPKRFIPQPRISAIEIQATLEKAYWKLKPKISDDKKELAAATLRSIALKYIK